MINAIAGKPTQIIKASDEKPKGWHCTIKERCEYILRSRTFCKVYHYRNWDYGFIYIQENGYELFLIAWDTGIYYGNRTVNGCNWLTPDKLINKDIHETLINIIDSETDRT